MEDEHSSTMVQIGFIQENKCKISKCKEMDFMDG